MSLKQLLLARKGSHLGRCIVQRRCLYFLDTNKFFLVSKGSFENENQIRRLKRISNRWLTKLNTGASDAFLGVGAEGLQRQT